MIFRMDPLDVVHGSNGIISIGIVGVADESKTTGTAGVSVLDDDL